MIQFFCTPLFNVKIYFHNLFGMSAKARKREKDIVLTIYRFRFENLFRNSDETLKITDDSNDTYRKRTAFFVHAHREAIK